MLWLGGASLEFGEAKIENKVFIKPSSLHSHGGTVPVQMYDQIMQEMKENESPNRFFVLVPIVNIQKSRTENSKAKNVFAKITYYDLRGAKVCVNDTNARWANSRQILNNDYSSDVDFIDIPAGAKEFVDIAMRNVSGKNWFSWNRYSYQSLEYRENKLPEQCFDFEISISGDNVYKKTSPRYRVFFDDTQRVWEASRSF